MPIPGIVDQDVEPAGRTMVSAAAAPAESRLVTSSAIATCCAPGADDFVGHRLPALLVDVGDRDGRTLFRKQQRDFAPDARARTVTSADLPSRLNTGFPRCVTDGVSRSGPAFRCVRLWYPHLNRRRSNGDR